MKKRDWQQLQHLWIYLAIPAVMLLYYNQSANWHYHITEDGIVVEHAHPFSNNMIPDTPFQDHEHSDFEYLVLAEISTALGLIAVVLMFLGVLFHKKKTVRYSPLPVCLTGYDHNPNPTRGPPCFGR